MIPQETGRKRLLLVGAVLITVIVAAVALVIDMERASNISAFRVAIVNLGGGMAQQTSAWFGTVDQAVKDIQKELTSNPNALSNLVQPPDDRAAGRFLLDRQKYLPGVNWLGVVDASGRITATSLESPLSYSNVSDRDFFRHFKSTDDDGAFVSAPTQHAAGGAWTSIVARRLSDGRGRFCGLVVAEISLAYLEDFYRLAMPPNRTVWVIRRDGVVLVRYPHAEHETGKTIPAEDPWYSLVAQGGGTYDLPDHFSTTRVVAQVQPLRNAPLVVEASVREEDALVSWNREKVLTILGGVASAVCVVLLLRFLASQFRRLEESEIELRAAKEAAEAAHASKSAFIANISHELRTPLNAIIGFSEVLKTQLFGALGSPRYVEYAADINSSGHHLLNLINELLDLSRIEAGRYKLSLEVTDLRDLIEGAIRMVSAAAREGHIQIATDISDDLQPLLLDRRAVTQVLLNLLSNAIKFTPLGGTVTIAAGSAEEGVQLSVADIGIGIAESDLRRLARPFEQVDNVLTRTKTGSGLGLALTKALVDQHGGRFEISSRVGEGTTVTARFPRQPLVREKSAA
jgi:signal transduction histidine kinase